MMLEQSATAYTQGNGRIERRIREEGGLIRTTKAAFERRYGVQIPVEHDNDIMPWIVKYSADCVNMHKVGSDGLTPYHRIKGKQSKFRLVPFGECILFQPLKSAKNQARTKLDDRYEKGVGLV